MASRRVKLLISLGPLFTMSWVVSVMVQFSVLVSSRQQGRALAEVPGVSGEVKGKCTRQWAALARRRTSTSE